MNRWLARESPLFLVIDLVLVVVDIRYCCCCCCKSK